MVWISGWEPTCDKSYAKVELMINENDCALVKTMDTHNKNSKKFCMNYSSWVRRRQYEEVPDELFEMPFSHHTNNFVMEGGETTQSLHTMTNGSNGTTNDHVVMMANHNNAYGMTNDDVDDTGQAMMVKIDVPGHVSRDEPRFPKEKLKTLYSFVILTVNFIFATTSLALVHERLPDREKYGPLPDIILDNIPAMDWALDVSEILIMIQVNSCIVLIAFHKHRFIVMRRVFLIVGLLYLMRSVTIYVTVLPVPSTTYYCSPKSNNTSPLIIAQRVFQLLSGFGLSINGKHTFCGDYIYSGHTVMLVLGYLIIAEYSPKNFVLIHWAAMVNAFVGVTMVLLAHGHYTIDVIIAYFVTTRLFWIYHTLSSNAVLKQTTPSNYLARVWWFAAFRYFERNVRGPVPRQYDCPISWPKRTVARVPGRES